MISSKKTLLSLILLLSLLLGSGCASAPPADAPVIDLGNPDQVQGAMEAMSGPNMLIRVPAGVEVPVSLKAKSGLFEFRTAEGGLTAKRDLWVWLSEGDFFISEDQKTWTPIDEALGGSLSIGAGVRDGRGFVDVGLDVEAR